METLYEVLYRKYRPKNFDEVIGQEKIKMVLRGSMKDNKIPHGYLFHGTHGIGKTTMARIFARELGTDPVDIFEIDGASYNGVDNIRELKEEAFALPFLSRFKVYIIDEVHMLSGSAFNAFLKLLEEPPAHCIFLLATTELYKVPSTIVSRVINCHLETPTFEHLKTLVLSVCEKEGFNLTPEILYSICLIGNHAFRDTLAMLEQVSLAFDLRGITSEKEILDFLGIFSDSDTIEILDCIEKKDIKRAFIFLDAKNYKDSSLLRIFSSIIRAIGIVMELRITGNQLLLSNESETMRNWIIKASKESPHMNSKMLMQLMETEGRIKRQSNYNGPNGSL